MKMIVACRGRVWHDTKRGPHDVLFVSHTMRKMWWPEAWTRHDMTNHHMT